MGPCLRVHGLLLQYITRSVLETFLLSRVKMKQLESDSSQVGESGQMVSAFGASAFPFYKMV